MNALTVVKPLPGQGRGALRGYRITSVVNARRQVITVLARSGREALALFSHQMGETAPKVSA